MRFEINGFSVDARYSSDVLNGSLVPLVEKLTAMARASDRRLIVFLAAPPASGKSTLAAMLEYISESDARFEPIRALGIDGYHYPASYIKTHTVVRNGIEVPMSRVKGAPDTFDTEALSAAIDTIRTGDAMWNGYSRVTHDVVPDMTPVDRRIALIEGNWLLYDSGRWADLKCDLSIWLDCDLSLLKERLIERKIRGGLTRSEAEAFYTETDGPNADICAHRRRQADIMLKI